MSTEPYEERDDDDVVMTISTITIERFIDQEGRDRVSVEAVDNNGEVPALIELLGMLDLARDTAYHMHDDDPLEGDEEDVESEEDEG